MEGRADLCDLPMRANDSRKRLGVNKGVAIEPGVARPKRRVMHGKDRRPALVRTTLGEAGGEYEQRPRVHRAQSRDRATITLVG
jgi:hypothetical protein